MSPGHSTIHSKRSISCENEGPIHLISEQEKDKEQQPAGDGPITTATKDTVVLLEYADKTSFPVVACVAKDGSLQGYTDAKLRLEVFGKHIFGRNLTLEPEMVISMREINLSDEDAVSQLRDLYHAERLLSLGKDFPPTKINQQIDRDSSLSPQDKARAKFTETMLTQHARRIAVMNQAVPSQEELREVEAIESFLSSSHDGDSSSSSSSSILRDQYCYQEGRSTAEHKAVLKGMLEWFRESFPYYYSGCTSSSTKADKTWPGKQWCNEGDRRAGSYIGSVFPSKQERVSGRAGVTELYLCPHCREISRFARYHSMRQVLSTRRGRCGEYSILIMRMLEQLGYESRYVADWADHVWAEVKLGDDWVHVDSCEAAIDEPLIYSSWGKKQTHIYSFQPHRPIEGGGGRCTVVEDVTSRYTPAEQWEGALERREEEGMDQGFIEAVMSRAAELITRGVDDV
jgi:hypothetical protein